MLTWNRQLQEYKPGMSMVEGVEAMNTLVTPCPLPPRVLGFLWRPRRHQMIDFTGALNTITYTTLDRCADCGLLVLTFNTN